MRLILLTAVLTSLLAVVVVACGGSSGDIIPTPGPGGETVIRVEMGRNGFSLSELTVRAGGEYLLELRNKTKELQNLRIVGLDGLYGTDDDLVSDLIGPGETGTLGVQIDEPGVYDFHSDSDPISMVGTLTVWEAPPLVTPGPPTPSPTAAVESPTPSPTAVESPLPMSTPAGE